MGNPIAEGFAKALKSSYKGFFGFSSILAEGVALGDSFLPIDSFHEPAGHYVKMKSTSDEAVMLQLLRARNLKAIRLFINYKDSDLSFVSDMMRLSDAKIAFTVSVAIGRYSFGKRAALYVLRDKGASISMKRPPHPMNDLKVVAFDLDLPSAYVEQGAGTSPNLKKIK